jgi:hypothetical protein
MFLPVPGAAIKRVRESIGRARGRVKRRLLPLSDSTASGCFTRVELGFIPTIHVACMIGV